MWPARRQSTLPGTDAAAHPEAERVPDTSKCLPGERMLSNATAEAHIDDAAAFHTNDAAAFHADDAATFHSDDAAASHADPASASGYRSRQPGSA